MTDETLPYIYKKEAKFTGNGDVLETKEVTVRGKDLKECENQILKQTKNKFITAHHIDYDKMNCEENNLISLCNYCNIHANLNREDWEQKFNKKMELIQCDGNTTNISC